MHSVLHIAEKGFRVLPILKRNKIPILDDWTTTASSDFNKITEWMHRYPDCNWGLLTGEGFFVLDIDPKNGGLDSWNDLVKQHGEPMTVTCITGSKGYHLYFKMPLDFVVATSSNKVARGIDIRSVGGQVIIPPSTHSNGNVYEWAEGKIGRASCRERV